MSFLGPVLCTVPIQISNLRLDSLVAKHSECRRALAMAVHDRVRTKPPHCPLPHRLPPSTPDNAECASSTRMELST